MITVHLRNYEHHNSVQQVDKNLRTNEPQTGLWRPPRLHKKYSRRSSTVWPWQVWCRPRGGSGRRRSRPRPRPSPLGELRGECCTGWCSRGPNGMCLETRMVLNYDPRCKMRKYFWKDAQKIFMYLWRMFRFSGSVASSSKWLWYSVV